jgi:hypothetical protein
MPFPDKYSNFEIQLEEKHYGNEMPIFLYGINKLKTGPQ